jgi:hypothetical protein
MNPPERWAAGLGIALEFIPAHGIAIVTLRGDHGRITRARISEGLMVATDHAWRVIVDLTECAAADISLVEAIRAARARFDQRGIRLEAVIPPDAPPHFAELARLGGIWGVHASWAGVIER